MRGDLNGMASRQLGILENGRPSPLGSHEIDDITNSYTRGLRTGLETMDRRDLRAVVLDIMTAMESGKRVLIAGNGGSSSTAAHMCGDLNAAALASAADPGFAMALSDNTPTVTALANDFAYDQIFARQVALIGDLGDLFVAISVSGASANLIEAARVARAKGMRVLSLLGQPGPLTELSDTVLVVGAGDYGLSEDLHLAVNHMIVRALRRVDAHTCQLPTVRPYN